jgi:transposase
VEPTREKRYKRRIAKLEAQLAQRDERIAALEKQVAELIRQNKKLTEQIAKLSKNSSNSSKPPSSDIVKPPRDQRSTKRRLQGGQPGHPGVNRQPFTSEQIDDTQELHAKVCDCGCRRRGKKLDQVRIHQFAELRDDPLMVTEYRLHGYVCPRCGQIVWAQLPDGVIEGQLFGPRLQALIGYMKGSLHASYSGLEAFCREVLNINVARSHLCNVIKRVNAALATPYEELKEHIPTEPVLNIDETGWKDKGIKYWAWVFCSPMVSFFWIAKSRSSKVLEEILGQTYGGTIVSDFFSAYVKYANKLQQFCLAHLIRDIKFLTTLPDKNDKDFGDALLMQFKKLFRFWHQRDKIPKDQFDRRMLRIKKRVLDLAEQEDLPAKSATLAKRLRKHGDAIFRFLFDPAVPPTNNGGEQSIRQLVIDRRITQGSRSPMGRHWNARIWTVLDTCRKQGRSAWQFLQNALSAYYFQSPTPSLLPQA